MLFKLSTYINHKSWNMLKNKNYNQWIIIHNTIFKSVTSTHIWKEGKKT